MNTIAKKEKLDELYVALDKELKENILQFWIDNTVDTEKGGFLGFISDDLTVIPDHDKSSVLNSRILWTFSAAYRMYGDEKYLDMANRAYGYITKYFIDKEYSGVYWMVDFQGNVANPKKQVYAVAFTIYAFTEYHRATGNQESLEKAIELFEMLEKYAYDNGHKGYIEALSRDWTPLSDMSLSDKDINAGKSMNTHLHVLEAYTNLLRVWDNPRIRSVLKELIHVTLDYIIDTDEHCFKLFFDMEWKSLSGIVSFGHDIEGSWLLYEAAEVLNDPETLAKAKDIAIKMAQKVYDNGIDSQGGGLFNEKEENGEIDDKKDWWPQAEAMVGFYNAYQLTGSDYYLDAVLDIWDFTDKYIIDKRKGEWFWGVQGKDHRVQAVGKVGPWKCPYHNSRMCFEIIHRLRSNVNITK